MADHEIPHVHFLCPSIFSQFFVSCDFEQMPNVTFHIQGQEFPLPPSAYTIQVPPPPPPPPPCLVSNSPVSTLQVPSYGCLPGFSPTYDSTWILGDIFIRQYYTVFNSGQRMLGLARAKWPSTSHCHFPCSCFSFTMPDFSQQLSLNPSPWFSEPYYFQCWLFHFYKNLTFSICCIYWPVKVVLLNWPIELILEMLV